MPRHWNEPGEPGEAEGSDQWYEVREWSAGQAVQLRQSLLQLADQTRGTELARIFAIGMLRVPSFARTRRAELAAGARLSRIAVPAILLGMLRATSCSGKSCAKPTPPMRRASTPISCRLAKLMSTLNPDRSAVAAAATTSAQLADQFATKFDAMPYDRAITIARPAADLLRCRHHLESGRARRRASRHGASIALRRLRSQRKARERTPGSRRYRRPFRSAANPVRAMTPTASPTRWAK